MFTRYFCLAVTGLVLAAPGAPAQSNKDLLKSSPQLLATLSEVTIKPSYSTVRVKCDGKDVALGTIVRPDGWIVTKASELKSEPTCVIKGSDKELRAKLVGVDPATDLAMLKVDASGLPAVEWRDTAEAPVGSWVITPGQGKEPLAVGVVSVGTRELPKDTFKFSPNPNSGFMGVFPQDKDDRIVISQVDAGTPASKAGIKTGDVVVGINDTDLSNSESMLQYLAKTKPDQEITVKLVRDGKPVEVKVKLARRPPNRGDFQNTMGSTLSERRRGFPVILQHDTVLKPTECGGPLVDLDGRAIGINIARAGRTESYAIPSEVVQTMLVELMSGKMAPKVTFAAARLKNASVAKTKAQVAFAEAKKQADEYQKKMKEAEKLLKDADDAVKKAQAEVDSEKVGQRKDDVKKDEPQKDK
jgi:serine protease Do